MITNTIKITFNFISIYPGVKSHVETPQKPVLSDSRRSHGNSKKSHANSALFIHKVNPGSYRGNHAINIP
jgi:hypothetical protein